MDKQQLHKMLEQLHAELSQARSVEGDELELLKNLKRDVQAILERAEGEASPQQYSSLGRDLQAAIRQFEVSHPALTWAMGEVLEILSRAGV
jgi:predicted component of type VI protein secretion system